MAKDGAAAQGAKALPKKAPVGLLAARRAFEIVGSLLLGSLTGLGGGVVRDLIIGVTRRLSPSRCTWSRRWPLHCWSTFSHAVSSGSRGHC
jgi:hypothetical protein